jgi:primosomal protein N' (replication factor Y)
MPDHKRVVQVAVPRPLHSVYDYHIDGDQALPAVGARLRVPFGRSEVIGICINTAVETPHAKTKAIVAILDDDAAIAEELLDLAQWMSSYYHYPLGEVLGTILPSAARKGADFTIKPEPPPDVWCLGDLTVVSPRAKTQQAVIEHMQQASSAQTGDALIEAGFNRAMLRKLEESGALKRQVPDAEQALDTALAPTPEQDHAISQINAAQGFDVFALEGVTGSGKTEVYLQSMAPVLNAGKQVLVLVPEIALTPQTLARFQNRFGHTGMLHSALTDQQRLQTWLRCRAGELRILIGTRSAVFTPFAALGLIIVDEEHDSSYKQQEGLRYSARDLTVKRAQSLDIPLLLGSATPSLETVYNVQRGRYRHLTLLERAGGALMPSYHTIDLRGQILRGGLSATLIRDHSQSSQRGRPSAGLSEPPGLRANPAMQGLRLAVGVSRLRCQTHLTSPARAAHMPSLQFALWLAAKLRTLRPRRPVACGHGHPTCGRSTGRAISRYTPVPH